LKVLAVGGQVSLRRPDWSGINRRAQVATAVSLVTITMVVPCSWVELFEHAGETCDIPGPPAAGHAGDQHLGAILSTLLSNRRDGHKAVPAGL
jgi:hypothetical protein